MPKRISIFGLWHQGSILSACFADMGHHVLGVGDDERAVALLNAAQPPVYEPKLKSVIRRNRAGGRLEYTTDHAKALKDADFAYIAFDTPVNSDDESDLSGIFKAAQDIGRCATGDLTVCVTAQVPVGTCHRLIDVIRSQNPRGALDIAYVPEFLQLGSAVETFRRPDRVVIGAETRTVAERISEIYKPLGRPVLLTGLLSAEMCKHASNSFLATSISFINEIADLCDEVGSDVTEVVSAMKYDRRIGRHAFLSPGLGFAGGTLGREIRALQKIGESHGCPTPLMTTVMEVNRRRPQFVIRRLYRIYDSLSGLRFAILGLTYKPGTSTLRRAISLEIIRDMLGAGATVAAFDPLASLTEISNLPPFELCADPYQAAAGSDALILITEWDGIRDLDLSRLRRAMRRPVVIDTRNWFDHEKMTEAGFVFSAVGRGIRSGEAVE